MMKKALFILAVTALACLIPYWLAAGPGPDSPCSLTILYDNYVSRPGTKADWGFSCLVRGMEKTILFDTGTRPDILFHNMKELQAGAREIQLLVLSHMHGDHTGGVPALIEQNPLLTVFIPAVWPAEFAGRFLKNAAKIEQNSGPAGIVQNVHLTGGMGDSIVEQAMVLDTAEGLVVITGCAHPGIVPIVKKAKEMLGKPVYLVLGGFHLVNHSETQIRDIIAGFRQMGVRKCSATHCTGDPAIKLFREAYGDDYLTAGTGAVIPLPRPAGK